MAAPTAPTISTIVAAALADAGYGSPSTALTTVAEGEWMGQIKNDIWAKQKKLKCLQKVAMGITSPGISRYANPSDFASDLKITLLTGDSGTAQDASGSNITLAADDPETDLVGTEILITAGTGAGSISQVTAYDTATKVATVSPSWTVTPVTGDTYMRISRYIPLRDGPAWDYDSLSIPTQNSEPSTFYAIGDEDYGEFIFDTAPTKIYGMRNRYFANLMNLDLTSTTHSTFVQRFQTVISKGIFSKALKRKDDDRWIASDSDYKRELDKVCDEEKYGTDNSTMTQRVTDFQ